MKKMLRRPVRLDRAVEPGVFDLEPVRLGFRASLRVARLFRRPVNHLRGRSGAPR